MVHIFNEQHDLFRKTVRNFAEHELAPHVDEWERNECFPAREVFKRAGELGILGAHYSEDVGGSGGDYWFSVIKCEELPRCNAMGVAMGLFVQSDIATPILADIGTKDHIQEFLIPALRGEKIAALAVTEPDAGSDVAALRTTALRKGDDYIINGSKTYITNGTQCDFFTLLAKTDPNAGAHGCSFFLVPSNLSGITVSKKLRKIGNHSSDTAELFFDQVHIPKRFLLGEENRGFMHLMQCFQSERLVASFASIALAQQALMRTIEYGRTRIVMGRPLIERESWQHTFVDLATHIEAAQALNYRTASMYNHEKYELKKAVSIETTKQISMCKIFACELTSRVLDTCLQFHGGLGYMEETWVARAWRDQRLFRIGGGATEVMRYYVAKLIGLRLEPFKI